MQYLVIYVCGVVTCGCVLSEWNMSDSDNDISWLTQQPSLDMESPTFDLGMSYVEEDICFESDKEVLVSLEDQPSTSNGRRVLYDNVTCEDISSDECVDSM